MLFFTSTLLAVEFIMITVSKILAGVETHSIQHSVFNLERQLIQCSYLEYEEDPQCPDALRILDNGQEIEVPLPKGAESIVGGNGQVWFVGSYAVKQARDDDELVKLCREKLILKHLNGDRVPRLVPIQESEGFEQCSLQYMITEKVGETTLNNIKDHDFSLSTGVRMVERLFTIVKSLHDKGILHSDLHADNILLTLNDPVNSLRIIDFGDSVTTVGGLKPNSVTPWDEYMRCIYGVHDIFRTRDDTFFKYMETAGLEILRSRRQATFEEWMSILQQAADILQRT